MNLFEEYETFRNQFKDVDYTKLSIGDELLDGSVVVEKSDKEVLIAAPRSTDKSLSWRNKEQVLQGLVGPWFIPSKEELRLTYRNLRRLTNDWSMVDKYFSAVKYWSSNEFSSADAFYLSFYNGCQRRSNKDFYYCVRAFRRVYL